MESVLAFLWLARQMGRSTGALASKRHRRVRAPGVNSSPRITPSAARLLTVSPPVLAPEPVPESRLEIRCFGRFEVLKDGKNVQDWRRAKARSLLKYLVDRRHPVPRDLVMDLLWPQSDSGAAGNSLRVALHALRQALGPCEAGSEDERDYVLSADGNLSLNPLARVWVDVEEFSAHFAAGLRFERQRRPDEAAREYELAEDLYRDDYLIEDLYADWTIARREQLKDQYLLLITKLADLSLLRGDLAGCIVRCHRIVEKDACREDAYRRLMRCYHQLGQRSRALHWYEICVGALRRELDCEPADETERLCRTLRSSSPSADVGTASPSLPTHP